MEDSLMLILGPPPDGGLKNCFESYQESRKTGKEGSDGDWEAFEKEIVGKLF